MMTRPTQAEAHTRGFFLTDFFLFDVMFSRHLPPKVQRQAFEDYADIYCLQDKEWLNDAWHIVSSDLFRYADSPADYHRLVRLANQYPQQLSDTERYILSHKAPAVEAMTELSAGRDGSFEAAVAYLESRAESGDVACMALSAFLTLRENGRGGDKGVALRYLRRAATWNDLFSILMGIRYSEDKPFYESKLCAVLGSHAHHDTLANFRTALGVASDVKPDRIVPALNGAFCRSAFDPRMLRPDIYKLLASTVMDTDTKCRLIEAADGKESCLPGLPLNITKAAELHPRLEVFNTDTTARAIEADRIITNLAMLDIRHSSSYKPLLLVCENKLVHDHYRRKLVDCFAGCKYTHLSLNPGEQPSLSASPDNAFVTAMDRLGDKNVVVFVDNVENILPGDAGLLAKLLSGPARAHFGLNTHPAVSLDLSGVLPVLMASAMPDPHIARLCDVVMAKDLSPDEFDPVLRSRLRECRDLFHLSSLEIEQAAVDFLFDYAPEAVTEMLNKAISRLRTDSTDIVLTVSAFETVLRSYHQQTKNHCMWGGSI